VSAVTISHEFDRVRVRDLTRSGSLCERIELSDGSERAGRDDPGDAPYHEEAVVPTDAWRRPSQAELRDLSASPLDAGRDHDDVLVVPLSQLVDAVRTTLERPAAPLDSAALLASARSPAFRAALAGRVDDLAPFCRSHEGLQFIGPSVSLPGQRTCTVDYQRLPFRRIGLHVDSWDGGIAAGRAGGRRRLCINAGESSRYFLFVARPISALAKERSSGTDHADRVAASFLAAQPHWPIVRLRLDPGEAYVASTEDLIHDGSTAGATTLDLSLQFLGYFGAPEQ
jgi:hypothetical protein